MSTEQNKAIVLQFYKAFDSRNIDQALALLAPNFVAYMAGVPEPLNGDDFKQFGLVFYLAFPDGQHTFDQVITEGDKVAGHMVKAMILNGLGFVSGALYLFSKFFEGLHRMKKWLNQAQVFYRDATQTIRDHLEGICNYFISRTTSGVMEGINNRIKLIMRQGYGFTNFDNFRDRLLACLSCD